MKFEEGSAKLRATCVVYRQLHGLQLLAVFLLSVESVGSMHVFFEFRV